MSNYQFSSDLIDDALFRAGERTDGNSDYEAKALTYLNRAYQGIWMGGAELMPDIQEDWWWLRKSPPGLLTLRPVYTTGTVTVTNDNTAITFTDAPADSKAGWFFKVDQHEDVFRISTHVAGAVGAVLDGPYTGVGAALLTFKVFKMEYDLASDVLRIVSPMRAFRAERRYEIRGMDLVALEASWPLGLVESGMSDAFALVDEDTVRMNRYGGTASTDLIRVEYDYLYRPNALTDSGSEEPVVPRQWRKVLADWVTAWLMADKNDDRAGDAAGLARAGLTAMALENRHKAGAFSGNGMGTIRPRQDQYQQWVRGPLRTSAGLIIG